MITLRMYCPFLSMCLSTSLHIPVVPRATGPHSSSNPMSLLDVTGPGSLFPAQLFGIWTWQLAPDDCFALLIFLPQDSLFSCYLYLDALSCFLPAPSQLSSKWSTVQEDQGLTLGHLILGPHESHHTTIITRFPARLHRHVPHPAWRVARICPLPQQV